MLIELPNASSVGEPVAQADREATVEPEAGIGLRFLAGPELALQFVELIAHLDQRLDAQRRTGTDAA